MGFRVKGVGVILDLKCARDRVAMGKLQTHTLRGHALSVLCRFNPFKRN